LIVDKVSHGFFSLCAKPKIGSRISSIFFKFNSNFRF
jgi:hypothetical protein